MPKLCPLRELQARQENEYISRIQVVTSLCNITSHWANAGHTRLSFAYLPIQRTISEVNEHGDVPCCGRYSSAASHSDEDEVEHNSLLHAVEQYIIPD